MDEIIKIIAECNKDRRLLGTDEVKKICHIILKKKHYDFVKEIIIAKKHPNDEMCGGLFYFDKIFFFYDGIIKMLDESVDQFTDDYQIDGSTVDILNYYYLTIIFHELAHARQYYLSTRKYDSLEKKLFSFFTEIETDRDFYNNNYPNLLNEVNAINTSFVTATSLYSKLPLNFVSRNDKNVYQSVMLSMLLYNNYSIDPYKEIAFSPAERIAYSFTDEMLAKANMDLDKYVNMIINDKYTLYKKLMLGLPISYLEYAYVKLLIELMPQDENINTIKKLQKKVHE